MHTKLHRHGTHAPVVTSAASLDAQLASGASKRPEVSAAEHADHSHAFRRAVRHAQQSHFDEAIAIARAITHDALHGRALRFVAVELIKQGLVQRAEELVADIRDHAMRSRTHDDIASLRISNAVTVSKHSTHHAARHHHT